MWPIGTPVNPLCPREPASVLYLDDGLMGPFSGVFVIRGDIRTSRRDKDALGGLVRGAGSHLGFWEGAKG